MTDLFCVITQSSDREHGNVYEDVRYISLNLDSAREFYNRIDSTYFNIRFVKPLNKLLVQTKTDESYQTDGLINENLVEKADIDDDPTLGEESYKINPIKGDFHFLRGPQGNFFSITLDDIKQ